MANIHSFESMATLDGEGIRYGVFFTGCPLRCVYCHNPDTWFGSNNEYTSGSVPLTEEVKECIDHADMVILDIKFFDEESYGKYTGGAFKNFVEIGKYCSEIGKRLWLRTVVIPNINDTEEQIKKYAEFAKQFIYEKYELLAFHTMGFFKYENLNIENPLINTKPLSKEKLCELQKIIDNAQ